MRAEQRTLVYFAAPLFNPVERAFNTQLAHQIERYMDVFLPQRDGGLMMDLVRGGMSPDDAGKRVFAIDRNAMKRADILVGVLDGATIDEGVAFEIGFMYALGKYCIGYQTDMRRALPTGNNPMIQASLQTICDNAETLIATLREYDDGPRSSRSSIDTSHTLSSRR